MPLFRIMSLGGWRVARVVGLGCPCGRTVRWSWPLVRSWRRAPFAISASRATGASSPRPFAPTCSSRSATPMTPARSTRPCRRCSAPASSPTCSIDREGGARRHPRRREPSHQPGRLRGQLRGRIPRRSSEVQLKPRAVYTRAKVQADVQRILDVYRRQGRFAASVEPKIIELEQSRVNLVFEINEGGATKVKSIHSSATAPSRDSQLRDIISTTQQGWFDFLKGTAFYDPDRCQSRSRAAAPVLPQERLCRRARRRRPTPSSTATARASSSPSSIEEGELYNFGDVAIEISLARRRSERADRRGADQAGRRSTTPPISTRRSSG